MSKLKYFVREESHLLLFLVSHNYGVKEKCKINLTLAVNFQTPNKEAVQALGSYIYQHQKEALFEVSTFTDAFPTKNGIRMVRIYSGGAMMMGSAALNIN
jgi:hypothetical protein